MPKTLDTQGFSALREEVVRSEGRPSRSAVQQALIFLSSGQTPLCWFFQQRGFCYKKLFCATFLRFKPATQARKTLCEKAFNTFPYRKFLQLFALFQRIFVTTHGCFRTPFQRQNLHMYSLLSGNLYVPSYPEEP